jgi:hypothetical protein
MAGTLEEKLLAFPHRDLRGIAIRLGLRQQGEHQKAVWSVAIAAGWRNVTTATHWLSLLSPLAQQALARLLAMRECPAAPFWGEYGPVRQVTARIASQTPPWQAPENASEELYYLGLLHPQAGQTLRQAQRIGLPVELQPLLQQWRCGDPASHEAAQPLDPALTTGADAGWTFAHDLGQLLIYLHQQWAHSGGDFVLHRHRRLRVAEARKLGQRLLQPEQRLEVLLWLATTAGLLGKNHLTPRAWHWLQAAPTEQIRWLWRAWCDDAAHAQEPDGPWPLALPLPWPKPLVQALQQAQGLFTAVDLTHGVLRSVEIPVTYWAAHLPDLQRLDQLIAALLMDFFVPLGLVAPAHQAGTADIEYGITRFGRWLLRDGEVPVSWPITAVQGTPPLPQASEEWLIPAATGALYDAQATLAAYSDYVRFDRNAAPGLHWYRLSPASVARAAAVGLGLPALGQALTALHQPPDAEAWQQLWAWHSQGTTLHLTIRPLLQAKTPAALAAVWQIPNLRPLLGEILSPTTATLQVDLNTARQALNRAALFPNRQAMSTRAPTARGGCDSGQVGALWLAGQLYAWLGEHLSLPLPPPFATLQQLWTELTAEEQAVVAAQWEALREQLLDLVDAFPFTPPPHPSDPTQWRLLLEAAATAKHDLELLYFSAGRNLLTRRRVQPFWVIEAQGISYLIAYCHPTARVLTFRLDRIQAITAPACTAPDDEVGPAPG